MVEMLNATEVRKDWSSVVDETVRNRPQFFKRTRDHIFMSDFNFIDNLLDVYKFNAKVYKEKDGSYTMSLDDIDIIENGRDREEALNNLAKAILEYAEDFYNEFTYWSSAPNRKKHIPYVFKALVLYEPEKIARSIICRDGKN